MPKLPSNESDAALLRAYADYRKLIDEANAGGHRCADGDISDECGDRIVELGNKVCDLPAETLDGIAVKLRAAAYWIGQKEPHELEDLCVLSALETVERLAGRAI